MRDLCELNINRHGKAAHRGAPTAQAIAAIEKRLGYALPSEYLELLRHSNGGHPELDSILPKDPRRSSWAIARFFFVTDEESPDGDSLSLNITKFRPILGDNALPFASDGGGNVFFLAMERTPAPVNIYLQDEGEVVRVAACFAALIDSLEMNPDYI
jgi:hypothetical protein